MATQMEIEIGRQQAGHLVCSVYSRGLDLVILLQIAAGDSFLGAAVVQRKPSSILAGSRLSYQLRSLLFC